MDPRLYHFERRTPRLSNPTLSKSQFVTDSLHIYRGGPLDPHKQGPLSLSQSTYSGSQSQSSRLHYYPPQISKIRSVFQNNRSKVPLSNLSTYAKQVMFPTQKSLPEASSNFEQSRVISPQKFFKKQLFLDNKEKNYIKQISKMNDQFLEKSKLNKSLQIAQPAGKYSLNYNDRDKRYYRYKHDYHKQAQVNEHKKKSQSLNKPFMPSRLNYADELKGII